MAGGSRRQLLNHYRDSCSLSARLFMHERFSTSRRPWFLWVFDHFLLPGQAHILELGSGNGLLWSRNLSRLPRDWRVVLSELSSGMLRDAQLMLGVAQGRFHWTVADADSLPFSSQCFDCVVANHMLYHVPSVDCALGEVHRVLRPGGKLYATTNGRQHMQEMWELVAAFDPGIIRPGDSPNHRLRFSLDNGAEALSAVFAAVTVHHYDNYLRVTEAEPLVAHVLSTLLARSLAADSARSAEFRKFVEDVLWSQGAIHITTDSGLFEARRD
jgi:SAM-dependent methyltransferase